MNRLDNWRPTASVRQLEARATLLRAIRQFFLERDVLEVETPLISAAGNTDPEINSIRTDDGNYLRTSPEFALKRLLAAGSGDIFELGRVFRDGESGRHHNPEFTMLEWYRLGFSYHQLMDEVAALVRACGQGKFDHWRIQKLSYQELFQTYLNLDPFGADAPSLAKAAARNGIDDIDLDREQWLDLLISMIIQPALPKNTLTFVYDYPSSQAALARIRPGTPAVAERFELFLGQTELANGYQELTDATEQQQRFTDENKQRNRRGQLPCAPDTNLVAALQHGMPECAGVALGVDRLLMAIEDSKSMQEVIAFPFSRA